jgi:hypothetical protein
MTYQGVRFSNNTETEFGIFETAALLSLSLYMIFAAASILL